MKRAVIFDIDGTLADCTHRLHHIDHSNYTGKSDWPAFWAGIPNDAPVWPVINLCNREFMREYFLEVLLVTGRSENNRKATEEWLSRHGVWYDRLLMRKQDCFRHDYVVKEEILDQLLADGYRIEYVVEDRQQVVDMWRRRGIVCLQCAKGDY